MRSLVVTRCRPFLDLGGMEKYSFHLCVGLSLSGAVVLVCGEGIYLFKNKRMKNIIKFNQDGRGSSLVQIILANWLSLKILMRWRILNIYAFGHSAMLTLLLCKFRFFNVDNTFFLGLGYEAFLVWPNAKLKLRVKNLVHRSLARISMFASKVVLVIEESQRSLFPVLDRRGKIKVLENFVDLDTYYDVKPSSQGKPIKILSLGRNCQSKNRHKILSDWLSIVESHEALNQRFALVIVSSGLPPDMVDQIKKTKSVDVLENVSDDVFIELRELADAEFSYSTQGIPVLTALEGMAFGNVPIVDNSHGGFFDQSNSLSLSEFIQDIVFHDCEKTNEVKRRNLRIVSSRSLVNFYANVNLLQRSKP